MVDQVFLEYELKHGVAERIATVPSAISKKQPSIVSVFGIADDALDLVITWLTNRENVQMQLVCHSVMVRARTVGYCNSPGIPTVFRKQHGVCV